MTFVISANSEGELHEMLVIEVWTEIIVHTGECYILQKVS